MVLRGVSVSFWSPLSVFQRLPRCPSHFTYLYFFSSLIFLTVISCTCLFHSAKLVQYVPDLKEIKNDRQVDADCDGA